MQCLMFHKQGGYYNASLDLESHVPPPYVLAVFNMESGRWVVIREHPNTRVKCHRAGHHYKTFLVFINGEPLQLLRRDGAITPLESGESILSVYHNGWHRWPL